MHINPTVMLKLSLASVIGRIFCCLIMLVLSSPAAAEQVFPHIELSQVDGTVTRSLWEEMIWNDIFHGKHLDKVSFVDPDNGEVIHQLRLEFDGDRIVKLTLDGRANFYFTDHFRRIDHLLSSDLSVEEGEQLMEKEYEVTAKSFLEFLQFHSTFFRVQKHFFQKKTGSNPEISFSSEWTTRGVAVGLELIGAALFVSTFAGIPEPFSPLVSRSLSYKSQLRFRLAQEIRRRRNLELKNMRHSLTYRAWKSTEKTSFGGWVLRGADKQMGEMIASWRELREKGVREWVSSRAKKKKAQMKESWRTARQMGVRKWVASGARNNRDRLSETYRTCSSAIAGWNESRRALRQEN